PRTNAGCEVLVHARGHEELGVFRPSIELLDQLDLFLAERLAVRSGRVLPMRGAITDVAVEDDEGGTIGRLSEDVERVLDPVDVVGVADPQHVPPVCEESRLDVLGERDARAALDRDPVVVVNPAEVVETEMRGERRGLRRDALHHAAVAAYGVDVVVEDRKPWTVVAGSEPLP